LTFGINVNSQDIALRKTLLGVHLP